MRITTVVASILICLVALAGAPAFAAGSLSGTVVSVTGGPLPCRVDVSNADGTWVNSADCEPAGRYTVGDLAAGSFIVRAEVREAPQYTFQLYPGTVFWQEATPVAVVDGQDTAGVDFVLTVGATITGTVREHLSGEPIAAAWVSVNTADWGYATQVESDRDGTYTLQGIPPVPVYAACNVEDGIWVWQYWDHAEGEPDATLLTLASGETVSDLDFDLFREATISGVVLSAADGAPIADASVGAANADYSVSRDDVTAADGTFRIPLLPPGTYSVVADALNFSQEPWVDDQGQPVMVTVSEGQAVAGALIELAPGGAISGRVTRAVDGSPVADGYAAAWETDTWATGSAGTDQDGRFRIEGLPTGDYHVYAEGAGGENLVPRVVTGSDGAELTFHVEVGAETTGVDLALAPGGGIEGVVRSARDGAPLAGVYVYANHVSGVGGRDTMTGDDGRFALTGLAAGDHVVATNHADWVHQAYDHVLFDETATPVRVTVGETAGGVDFDLTAAGRIAGRVVDAVTGAPVEGVWIATFYRQDVPLPGAWAVSAADGSYQVGSLPPGEWVYAIAYDDGDRYAWQWYNGALAFANATPVEVALEGVTTGVDFRLHQPGRLTVAPASLSLAGETYQDDIPTKALVVSNAGPGPALVELWSDGDWLAVDYDWERPILQAGETLTVAVGAWPWGLNAGTYSNDVVVANWLTGAQVTVPVTLTLTAAAPLLELWPTETWFDGEVGAPSPAPGGVWLANLGDGDIAFTVADDAAWLEVSPAAGTLTRGVDPTELALHVDTSSLAAGDHVATITLSSTAGERTITVYLQVAPAVTGTPDIVVPEQLTILIPPGLSKEAAKAHATATFEIANDGDGDLYWSARGDQDWVDFTPSSGTIAAGAAAVAVTVTADPAALADGMNSTVIEIGSSRDSAKVDVNVQIGSAASTSAVQPGGKSYLVVPVVVHAAGVNDSQFVSDVWISHRPTGRTIDVTLAFVAEDSDGSMSAITTRISLASGQTVSLYDVMANWLGGAMPKGSLVILSDDIDEVESSSRTYNSSKSGTFGQEIPALPARSGVTRLDGSLHLAGLAASPSLDAGFRSNLLLTEVDGRPLQVKVDLYDAAGAFLGTTPAWVKPFATTQLNNVFARAGYTGAATGARAEVSIVQGEGRLVAIGSTVDNLTNDPTTLFGTRKNAEVATSIIPVVANAPGVGGTQWVSDVAIANVDSSSRLVTVSYHTASGQSAGAVTHELDPGATLVLADVVGATFDRAGTRGVLKVAGEPVGGLVISSRTYNLGEHGTFGQGISAVPLARALRQGSDVLRLIALNNTARYRTNVGVSEVLGQPVRIGIVVLDQGGDTVLGYREVDVPANGQFQTNIFAAVGLGDRNLVAATAFVQVVSGDGGIVAYASTVDNQSTDATTLPPPERVGVDELALPSSGGPGGPGTGPPQP